jgi:hypothetical protein
MSDDPVERKEIPSEVGQIVEDAIDKIYNILLLNDPGARQRVAALIRSYIEGSIAARRNVSVIEDRRQCPSWLLWPRRPSSRKDQVSRS